MVPTRERLLAAAAELMFARGYEAVGVAELCERARAQRGSFYHHWPSKQALALAMLEREWERTKQEVFAPTIGGEGPVFERFEAYGCLLAERHRRRGGTVYGCRFGNLALELVAREPEMRKKVASIFAEMRDLFAAAFAEAVGRGELSPEFDAEDGADTVLALMEGLQLLAKVRNDPEPIAGLGRRLRQLFDDHEERT